VGKIIRLFQFEQASGVLMFAALLLALVAANSPLAEIYEYVHHLPVDFRFGPLVIEEPLVQWINEGLMVIFFLVVGLEIKRQLFEGHLSTMKRAALPAFAALGGMIVPALVYVGMNWADPIGIRGWAIPTATDIVLALGVLSMLGSRVPTSLKVFLTALAIFDDIAAVLIIGLFYGEPLSLVPLLTTLLAILVLIVLNRLCVVRPIAYVAIGIVLWVAMLKSGIEPALAGLIIALAIPLHIPGGDSPLRATERTLHPWSVLFVIPLFAFFNAGIVIDANASALLFGPVSVGIATGLFLGKQLGVFGAAWVAVALGLGQLPQGVSWSQIYGAGLLAGIGFTMSLFVNTLAFADPPLVASAKFAILIGSLLSAVAGLVVVHMSTRALTSESDVLVKTQ